ncbi:heterokaryon incompatibility, partial [Thozetella sp. PMI_491]
DYIALSYVWGPAPRKYLTKPNTVLGPLPQAIEDAMEVVRNLGKRFLWVDAVCIDQDDPSHKETQIGVMGRIYRAAWATIINVSGASADHPIPRVRDTTRFRQLQFSDGERQYVSTLPALNAYLRQSPWSSRGWVLQEGLMSRRCIYFTHSQVYFEC